MITSRECPYAQYTSDMGKKLNMFVEKRFIVLSICELAYMMYVVPPSEFPLHLNQPAIILSALTCKRFYIPNTGSTLSVRSKIISSKFGLHHIVTHKNAIQFLNSLREL